VPVFAGIHHAVACAECDILKAAPASLPLVRAKMSAVQPLTPPQLAFSPMFGPVLLPNHSHEVVVADGARVKLKIEVDDDVPFKAVASVRVAAASELPVKRRPLPVIGASGRPRQTRWR